MPPNNPRRRLARTHLWILLILGVVGLGLSVESYRGLRSSQSGAESWCSFGELSNCDKAYHSEYSHLFGRPISLYGAAAYFLIVAIAGLGLANGGPHLLASLFHLGLISFALLGATAYFAWALVFQVKTLCVMCVADYLVNITIAITSWRGCLKLTPPYRRLLRWDLDTLFGNPGNSFRTLLAVALFVVFGFVLVHQERQWYLYKRGIKQILSDEVQRVRTPWTAAFPTLGPPDAPVQAVLFGDHQCPYCIAAKKTWTEIMEEYPGLVRLTAVAAPSNKDCNPLAVDNTHHLFSCPAAHLSLAVYKEKGNEAFWELQEDLYSNGLVLDEDFLTYLAKERYGLSDEVILATWKKSRTPEGLEMHHSIARQVGVGVLPFTILNGVKIGGYVEDWALLVLLESELEKKGLRLSDYRKDS